MPPDFRAMEVEAAASRQRSYAAASGKSEGGGGGIGYIAVLIVIVLLIAIGAFGYFLRDRILAEFPQLGPVYELVGVVPAAIPGEGLEIRNESLSRVKVDGAPVLVLTGEIANLSRTTRPVPMLEATLLDATMQEVTTVTFEVELSEIAAGASVPFATRIEDPPPDVVNVGLDFVALPAAAGSD